MAQYEVVGNIAVVALNLPPVNCLRHSVLQSIRKCLEDAMYDKSVEAVLIYGKGGNFSAGADLMEFLTKKQGFEAHIQNEEVFQIIENSKKPVVAAIHGSCLGGGLVLALFAHYRVSHVDAIYGFPEVKMGIVPLWGITQLLPRATSMQTAIELIAFGENISAKKANNFGFLDKIVSGDIYEEGLKFAQSIIGLPLKDRKFSQKDIPDKNRTEEFMKVALHKANKIMKGQMAPKHCIKAVAAAAQCETFADGLKLEMKYAAAAFSSAQAQALQYAFFAERDATKWELPGGFNNKTVKGKTVKTGCVIGAGTMGTGITMAMLNAGIPVVLIEQNDKFLKRGLSMLKTLYEDNVKLRRVTPERASYCMGLVTPTTDYTQADTADIVIEAVFENMEVKKQVFRKLDEICKPGAILCTNTSALDIDEIASVTKRPEDVIGTHFFVPAYRMKLLENVKGRKTSPETIATATNFGFQINKVPVLVGNCYGFVGNRMSFVLTAEAEFLVEDGALPHEVDQAMQDFGLILGIFKVRDMAGLDNSYNRRKEMYGAEKLNGRLVELDGFRYSSLADILCKNGRLGQKTGRGWYRYERIGAKQPILDEDVTELIYQHCKRNNITRRKISQQEIQERCLYSMINEGFKILEEGIARKSQIIDTVWLMGYGWPRYTGGPMFYASMVGLKRVYERIACYHQEHPKTAHWKPSALLYKLSKTDLPFQDWHKIVENARL